MTIFKTFLNEFCQREVIKSITNIMAKNSSKTRNVNFEFYSKVRINM